MKLCSDDVIFVKFSIRFEYFNAISIQFPSFLIFLQRSISTSLCVGIETPGQRIYSSIH